MPNSTIPPSSSSGPGHLYVQGKGLRPVQQPRATRVDDGAEVQTLLTSMKRLSGHIGRLPSYHLPKGDNRMDDAKLALDADLTRLTTVLLRDIECGFNPDSGELNKTALPVIQEAFSALIDHGFSNKVTDIINGLPKKAFQVYLVRLSNDTRPNAIKLQDVKWRKDQIFDPWHVKDHLAITHIRSLAQEGTSQSPAEPMVRKGPVANEVYQWQNTPALVRMADGFSRLKTCLEGIGEPLGFDKLDRLAKARPVTEACHLSLAGVEDFLDSNSPQLESFIEQKVMTLDEYEAIQRLKVLHDQFIQIPNIKKDIEGSTLKLFTQKVEQVMLASTDGSISILPKEECAVQLVYAKANPSMGERFLKGRGDYLAQFEDRLKRVVAAWYQQPVSDYIDFLETTGKSLETAYSKRIVSTDVLQIAKAAIQDIMDAIEAVGEEIYLKKGDNPIIEHTVLAMAQWFGLEHIVSPSVWSKATLSLPQAGAKEEKMLHVSQAASGRLIHDLVVDMNDSDALKQVLLQNPRPKVEDFVFSQLLIGSWDGHSKQFTEFLEGFDNERAIPGSRDFISRTDHLGIIHYMTPIRTVALSLMESCGSRRPLGLPAGVVDKVKGEAGNPVLLEQFLWRMIHSERVLVADGFKVEDLAAESDVEPSVARFAEQWVAKATETYHLNSVESQWLTRFAIRECRSNANYAKNKALFEKELTGHMTYFFGLTRIQVDFLLENVAKLKSLVVQSKKVPDLQTVFRELYPFSAEVWRFLVKEAGETPLGALQYMGINDITELLATAHRENKITTQRYTQLRQEWVSHIQNAGYVQDVTDIMYGSSNPRTFSSPVTPPGERVINHADST